MPRSGVERPTLTSVAPDFAKAGFAAAEALDQAVGCSVRLLEKDFKLTTGRSIVDELNRVRLAKVQEILRSTSVSEAAVAAAAGFGSSAYLRNLFRKRFGLTMRAWRLQHEDEGKTTSARPS